MISFLCLVSLCLAHLGVHATSVREVPISVRSVKSIVYRGMQVSIFEHIEVPGRYFFQPLGFLDAASARLKNNPELQVTELHFDVYLWTDEFIRLIESYFAERKSVELLPLTGISLVWSSQASTWLGSDYMHNQTYRLLDDWKDEDKPHMRNTFTIFCNVREACEKLHTKFNESNEAIGNIFNLRYNVRGDHELTLSLKVRYYHFLLSPIFQQIERFASKRHSTEVMISEKTVDDLADEVLTAALAEQQPKVQQAYIDNESHKAILTDLHRLLRKNLAHSLTDLDWKNHVYWPDSKANIRPDKLANLFNQLFKVSSGNITLPNPDLMSSASEEISSEDYKKVDHFVQRKKNSKTFPSSQEVEDLAKMLGSYSVWNASTHKFNPPLSPVLYRIDLQSMRLNGIALMRSLKVHYKVTQHLDPVHPLPKDIEFQSSLWQRHFAGSFCILANQGEPPGMQCRVLSYRMPVKSLLQETRDQQSPSRPNIQFKGGHIGQNHFYRMNSDEFSFSLMICCTKDLKNT